jgi:hypothetical protein
LASQIREAGVHPASKNQRTIAVGVNKNGKQLLGQVMVLIGDKGLKLMNLEYSVFHLERVIMLRKT